MAISDEKINELLNSLLTLHPKRIKTKIDLSLDRTIKLLNKLGNPQKKLKGVIYVVGTNGKFSVLNFIREILKYNNKKTNNYISPHLVRFNERFTILDRVISNNDLYELLSYIKEVNGDDEITFFEITSSAFFKIAADHNEADYNIVEAGLGARADSTAPIDPEISVISSISMDHMDYLGNTIEQIAADKARAIRTNKMAIIGHQPFKEAQEVLLDYAKEVGAPTWLYDFNYFIYKDGNELVYEDNDNRIRFPSFDNLPDFQIKNLGLAIASVLNLYDIDVQSYLLNNYHQNVYFPGRFEKLENGKLNQLLSNNNELYLEGGHNVDAAIAVNESLKFLPKKKLVLILGMISSKNPAKYIREFKNVACIYTITIPNEESAIDASELKELIREEHPNVTAIDSIENALTEIGLKYPNSRVCILGSLYLCGSILSKN